MLDVPKRPKRKPAQSRPGPKPIAPTNRQRREVELAVATGMSLELIADALEISRRTLCRSFVRELACGRAKRLLAGIVRLDDLAAGGNTAAAKYLHSLMDRGDRVEAIEDDKWAAVASKIEADLGEDANCPKTANSGKTKWASRNKIYARCAKPPGRAIIPPLAPCSDLTGTMNLSGKSNTAIHFRPVCAVRSMRSPPAPALLAPLANGSTSAQPAKFVTICFSIHHRAARPACGTTFVTIKTNE